MPSKLLELRCDRNLLDSNFEGYKLSLNDVAASRNELATGVRKLNHPGDDFSYLYLELLSKQNLLYVDPWHENNIYYVDDTLSVIGIVLDCESGVVLNKERVFRIPTRENTSYRYNVTLAFVCPDLVVICDGADLMYILHTGCRSQPSTWTVEFDERVLKENVSFTLLDARHMNKNGNDELHCLLIAIGKKEEGKAQSELFWVQLWKDCNNWTVAGIFELKTKGSIGYGHLSPDGECLYIESTESLKLPSANEEVGNETIETSEREPLYYWKQNIDEIKIWFALPTDCVKEHIKIDVSEKHVCVMFDKRVFLSVNTFQRVDPNLTTWSIVDQRIELTMCKQEDGLMWRYLFENDDRGEEILDSVLVNEIHEKLAHLTSDKEVTSDDSVPLFNPGQLEACDQSTDENARLYVVERVSKKILKEVDFSNHKVLFNVRVKISEAPYLCSRHDVDGVLWKLDYNNENPCTHVATLKAFGYVLASKQSKYCTCSPDFSYAAITATSQNVFVYKQNCSVNSDLRNRITGHLYPNVGKQYLITLKSNDEILGIHTTQQKLILLTKTVLYVFNIEKIG